MDMFGKATKVAKEMSESVKNFGDTLYNSTREQSEMASLNVQKNVIEKKLNDSYAEIGKRYVEYMERCDSESSFDVNDILEKMKPDLEKWKEVRYQILEKEQKIKQMNEEKARKKAEYDFELEKEKLDKAFEMDILTQAEYDYKLGMAKMKLDNYELLRKYDLQLQMGIISKEEYDEKIKSILR